ncbi:MAG: ABC transporter substrate-binding protein [Rhodospirillales bacterium]
MALLKRLTVRLLFVLTLAVVVRPAVAAGSLRVGYIPIIPMSQLFVIAGKGWDKQAGLDLQMTPYSSGPAMLAALKDKDLDAVYFGIIPAMTARAMDIPLKVLASAVVEQVGLVARGTFSDMLHGLEAKEAILRFKTDQQRRLRIATLPKGSVPDTVGRYWLTKGLGLTEEAVTWVRMGTDDVLDALLAGSVDAAVILEPILTLVAEQLPGARVIARAAQMLPGQAGSVLAAREDVIATRENDITTLVNLHLRATRLLTDHPDAAAPHVAAFLGNTPLSNTPLSNETLGKALAASRFVADPHVIAEPSRKMRAFQAESDPSIGDVTLADLFDTRIYDRLVKP